MTAATSHTPQITHGEEIMDIYEIGFKGGQRVRLNVDTPSSLVELLRQTATKGLTWYIAEAEGKRPYIVNINDISYVMPADPEGPTKTAAESIADAVAKSRSQSPKPLPDGVGAR